MQNLLLILLGPRLLERCANGDQAPVSAAVAALLDGSRHLEASPAAPPPPPPPAPASAPAPTAAPMAAPTLRPTTVPVEDVGARRLDKLSRVSQVPREELWLFGNPAPSTVQLAVGFGSVPRQKEYLLATVGAMLGLRTDSETTLSDEERSMVVVVAHLASFNMTWVQGISKRLQSDYAWLVESGQLHALHAPEDVYPPLDICPPTCTYNDKPTRVKWRSKQNIDYAFLMHYAAPLAPYYLQLEDDLQFAPNWVSEIKTYVQNEFGPARRTPQGNPWRMIDFSRLGFIGKLFRSEDVPRLAQFLLLFYDQAPCDLLVRDWLRAMGQKKDINYNKSSLFRHIGIFRTLSDGGFQVLEEHKFGGKKLFDNPPGKTLSNMVTVPTYDGRFAYSPGGEPLARNDKCDTSKRDINPKKKTKRCWFWAKRVLAGDYFEVFLDKEVHLQAVFVQLGHKSRPEGRLQEGALQVATVGAGPGCHDWIELAHISNKTKMYYWEEGVVPPVALPFPVRCVRVLALASQEQGLIVWNILIRTSPLAPQPATS